MIKEQKSANKIAYNYITDAEKNIFAAYKNALAEINKELQLLYAINLSALAPEDYYSYMIKFDRLKKLKKRITEAYKAIIPAVNSTVEQGISAAMSQSYYRQQYISAFFSPTAGFDLSFSMLPPSLLSLTVTGNIKKWTEINKKVRDNIIAKYGSIDNYIAKHGATLTELLLSGHRSAINKLNQAIASALIQGKSYKDTANTVAGIIGGASNQKTTGAVANAIRILRTEGNRTLNAGAYAEAKNLAFLGVKVERMWVATLDLRTRDTHQQLDGVKTGVDEPFTFGGVSAMYPGDFPTAGMSINCRCTVVDVIDGVPPQARRGRLPDGSYGIFTWQQYPQWLRNNGMSISKSGLIYKN